MALSSLTIYPLDPTGSNPNNLITNEIQSVNLSGNTVVRPSAGFYYANSLIVTDTQTSQTLVKGEDYLCIELSGEYTAKYGSEICGMVLYLGTQNASNISLSYQCLGGPGQILTNNIQELIQNIVPDSQLLQWANLLNKPTLYTPTNHVNMLEDIYGFEPVVYAIERLKDVLQIGNTSSYQILMQWVEAKLANIQIPTQTFNYQDFIGNGYADITGTVQNYMLSNNLTFYNMPNGFRLYWQISTPYSSTYYSPAQGQINVSTSTSSNIEVLTNGYLLANTNLYLTISDYMSNDGSLFGWYTFNQFSSTFSNLIPQMDYGTSTTMESLVVTTRPNSRVVSGSFGASLYPFANPIDQYYPLLTINRSAPTTMSRRILIG